MSHAMCGVRGPSSRTGGRMSDHSEFQDSPKSDSIDHVISSVFGAMPSDEKKGDKPSHYKVICISMYTKDLKNLDDMVETLKAKGMTKANRSALIRYALGEVNLDQVPQGI
jgi:hypothetical protein